MNGGQIEATSRAMAELKARAEAAYEQAVEDITEGLLNAIEELRIPRPSRMTGRAYNKALDDMEKIIRAPLDAGQEGGQ